MLVAGRRAELAAVGRLLDGASRGAGGLLVISGPAGSGRTLIAEAAAAADRDRGFEVLWGTPGGGTARTPGVGPAAARRGRAGGRGHRPA